MTTPSSTVLSTDKQVDYDNNNEADIPMQRKACHRFADKMGWTIVHEEQEDGVSGHKIRAENRDKIQAIKELARKGKFDILLVFMFDRIGTESDVSPTKHRSLSSGSSRTASKYGVHRRANSALITILTSCSTISDFGRLTARAKRPLFAPAPASVRW